MTVSLDYKSLAQLTHVNAAPQNNVAMQNPPLQNLPQNLPQNPQQPAAPIVPSAAGQMASDVGVEAKAMLGSFVKDPAQIAFDKKLSFPFSVEY